MNSKMLEITEDELIEIVSTSLVEKRYELAMRIHKREMNKSIIELIIKKFIK